MTSIEKLALRLKTDFDIEMDVDSFYRTYAGYWQRSNGSWSWSAMKKGTAFSIGSQWPIKDLLKAKKLSLYRLFHDIDINVDNK